MSPSAMLVPGLLAGTAVIALWRRVDVYGALTAGAGEGLTVLLRITPSLVGLMTAVSMLQASGAMDALSSLCAPLLELAGIPPELTPLGVQAACRMARGQNGVASDELCLLVVLNTASIQLVPATVASVRAAAGAAAPLDILPAVWLSSALSVTVGLLAAKALARLGGRLG